MKNIGLKLSVIILFIIQAGTTSLFFYLFKFLSAKLAENNGILFNYIIINSLLLISLFISLIYVFVILFRSTQKVVYVPDVRLNQPVKETKESKQRHEKDLKKSQELAEKKRQILAELMKNLGVQLNLENYTNQALINISKYLDIFQGIFFVKDTNDEVYRKAGTYAFYSQEDFPEFSEGVGLTGQVAANKKLLNIMNIPEKYLTVLSGLGKSSPTNLIIFPILHNDKTIGIIEIASFIKFDSFAEQVLMEMSILVGPHLAEINKPVEVKDEK